MLVLTNTHMLKKNQESLWTEFQRWGKQNLNKQLDSEDTQQSDMIILFVFFGFNIARIGPYCNMKPELLFLEH